jgi:acetoin utilization deacetylase AcuC-like enzyme
VGAGAGRGSTVNLPLPRGCGDGEYARVYHDIVLPIGRAFGPELVLVSAAFDAQRRDPLAGMELTAAGYGAVMDTCLAIAAGHSMALRSGAPAAKDGQGSHSA